MRPGRTPGEDDSAADGDVKGRRMWFAVVVVVDDEGTNEIAWGGGGRDGVAVFFAGGDREEAESFFVVVMEMEWFRDEAGGAAGEETVGEPSSVEWVGGVSWSAAVNVVRDTCEWMNDEYYISI